MSRLIEDKAVDLYVLKRAFISTHPGSEPIVFSFPLIFHTIISVRSDLASIQRNRKKGAKHNRKIQRW
jgi:tRNA A-37 threonylcarbamoyl transferase component Bud32